MARIAFLFLLAGAAACGDDEPAAQAPAKEEPLAGLAELSPEDRTLAEAQAICPVSGKPLGSMGKPDRIEHEGTVVFFCCAGCRKPFEKEPAKYLARLGK